jgi:hypothetical protein
MRLRILDVNFRWFWFTLFFYSDKSPKMGYHVESNIYEYQQWMGPWLHFWTWEKWEKYPLGGYAMETNQSLSELREAE